MQKQDLLEMLIFGMLLPFLVFQISKKNKQDAAKDRALRKAHLETSTQSQSDVTANLDKTV